MADEREDRLERLQRLVDATDEARLLDLVLATVEVIETDTARVLDQIHIARDVAARTKAGDWFGNTELAEITSDADYFLGIYKPQRERIAQLKATLREKRGRLDTADR